MDWTMTVIIALLCFVVGMIVQACLSWPHRKMRKLYERLDAWEGWAARQAQLNDVQGRLKRKR